jgi:hypothetical protein
MTRDEILSGPEPVTRISLGSKVWIGNDGDPLVGEANYITSVLADGCFAAGRVLGTESLEDVISLGKVWLGQLEVIQSKLQNADSSYRARAGKDQAPPAQLPGTKPADLVATTFTPATDARTKDSRSTLFGSARTQEYAAGLKKARETQAPTAPTRVNTARDYAANLAALRPAKGAA